MKIAYYSPLSYGKTLRQVHSLVNQALDTLKSGGVSFEIHIYSKEVFELREENKKLKLALNPKYIPDEIKYFEIDEALNPEPRGERK